MKDEFVALPVYDAPSSLIFAHERRAHYRAIAGWCAEHAFERVSVWGFKRGAVPRYSSVTRDGYIGIGPGAGR